MLFRKKKKAVDRGNTIVNYAIDTDNSLNQYVRKNKRALLKLSEADKITLLNSNTKASHLKDDMKKVNTANVNEKKLNKKIRRGK